MQTKTSNLKKKKEQFYPQRHYIRHFNFTFLFLQNKNRSI